MIGDQSLSLIGALLLLVQKLGTRSRADPSVKS